MHLPDYSSLHVSIADGVATVVLDHPPVNTLDGPMMLELHDLLGRLREDDSTRVIVFESAHKEFFLAHVDFGIFESYPDLEAVRKDYPHVNVHQGIGDLLRSQPQVTIVKLAGIARAGGAEFVVAADMAFAGTERGKIAQSEVLLGIIPGGGGTQHLLERTGRNRALEAVLGADLLDAQTAALYGWINRAIPDAELDAFVARLAGNIAALDPGVIEGVKRAIPAADLTRGLNVEHDEWNRLVGGEAPAKKMTLAMERNLQSMEPERDLEGFLRQVAADI
jgi:enoyl-CoA hydratase/carnithine racemase